MDAPLIAKLAGPEVAKKLCDTQLYNTHMWNAKEMEIDGRMLDDMVKGAMILGAEPVDYPLTDGICLYLKLATGEPVTLEIEGADPVMPSRLKIYRTDL